MEFRNYYTNNVIIVFYKMLINNLIAFYKVRLNVVKNISLEDNEFFKVYERVIKY